MVNTKILEPIRKEYLEVIKTKLTEMNEVLVTASNKLAIPIEKDGEEGWLEITVAIPKGSKESGDYDGYEVADEYTRHLAEKEEKAKAEAEKKAKKIEADKKAREEKARKKAEREKAKEAEAE